MKNRTLLCLLLATGFVGATSCGDLTGSNNNSAKDAEIAALRNALLQAKNQQTVNVVNTVVQTAVVNVTMTSVTTSVTTSNGTTTTVVYTVTSTGTGTSSSTSTAGRQ